MRLNQRKNAEEQRLEQWEMLEAERKILLESLERGLVFYAPMEDLWETIEAEQIVIRRENRLGDTPFETLCSYVDQGFYPPPEYLKYLVRVLDCHVHSGGESALDELLLGRSKQKSGNYGAQMATEDHNSIVASMILRRVDEVGGTITAAAAYVAHELRLDVDKDFDLETLLRTSRRTSIWRMCRK